MMRLIAFLCTFVILTLTGCAAGTATNPLVSALMPTAPEISLKGFQLTKMGLTEQTYHLKLGVKNPNTYPLPIQSMNYQIFINNKPFFTGNSTQPISIPALGESYIESDINSNLTDVISGWQQWLSLAKRTLNYRITGNIGLSSYNVPIPFQYADKVDLVFTK